MHHDAINRIYYNPANSPHSGSGNRRGDEMNYKMDRDINGNKIVKISLQGFRGFSIQTNGNLPKTHKDHYPDKSEISGWVREYGTERQKELFGWY